MHKTSTLVSTSEKPTKNKQQAVMPVEIPDVSNSVIDSILNYSRSLTVKRSESIGFIEVVAS
jgi:hypothetical protein